MQHCLAIRPLYTVPLLANITSLDADQFSRGCFSLFKIWWLKKACNILFYFLACNLSVFSVYQILVHKSIIAGGSLCYLL